MIQENQDYLKKVWIFDNGGESYDRYTVIPKIPNYKVVTPLGKGYMSNGVQTRYFHLIYGCSINPFEPMGFGQMCGEISEFDIKYTIREWRRGERGQICLNNWSKECDKKCVCKKQNIEIRGKAKDLLSDEVKLFIKQIFEYYID